MSPQAKAIMTLKPRLRHLVREAHLVTQWREGCVYRTRSLGFIVCDWNYKLLGRDGQIGSVSTKVTRELEA